jgi:CBS domain-containing protein
MRQTSSLSRGNPGEVAVTEIGRANRRPSSGTRVEEAHDDAMNSQRNEIFEAARGRAPQGSRAAGPAPAETLRVIDVMGKPQPIVPSHILMGAARKIARLKSADALIVEEKGSLVGFLDARCLREAPDDRRVDACLEPLQLFLAPTTTVAEARALLVESGASSLPVAAGPFLLGSVSRAAVERSFSRTRTAAAAERTPAAA